MPETTVSPILPTQASAEAGSADSTPSAAPAPKEDITQPTVETKGRLERLLDEQVLGPLSPTTVLQHAIRFAAGNGVPLNTIVLLLLFPMVATIVAAARHLLGLRGFGIFTPAIIAVAFLATGLTIGIFIFLGTLAIATVGRTLTRRLRLQYLPRVSLLILFISVGVLLSFLGSPFLARFGVRTALANIGIFPILLLILLTETFISAQISHGAKYAAQLTAETLVLATISYLLIDLRMMQAWVLLHPEATIVSLAAVNVLLGRFTGLRALEYWRFRELLRK